MASYEIKKENSNTSPALKSNDCAKDFTAQPIGNHSKYSLGPPILDIDSHATVKVEEMAKGVLAVANSLGTERAKIGLVSGWSDFLQNLPAVSALI